MKLHLIATGGAVMHNMAICLKNKGYEVTGSDDEIFEPAKNRLEEHGLLPKTIGWDVDNISSDLDAVILGMHARKDNPELKRAQDLNIPVYSFPEYVYQQSKTKKRVVIGGSHGKTSITAMIMHVLKSLNWDFDYLVGSQLEGFDTMVKLTDEAPLIILEGDEYLSSAIDMRPKFHLYHPHIALLSGIAWDHINVFPTFENYLEQFEIFINKIEQGGSLIYCNEDEELNRLCERHNSDVEFFGYGLPSNEIRNNETFLNTDIGVVKLNIFGHHNLQNLEGARLVCNQLGITDEDFYNSISEFKGAAKRLEKIFENDKTVVFKDFAHSPSKLKATIHAVKQQYPERELVACMELHTFSSLNKDFLDQYNKTMDEADVPIVYYNPHTIKHKKLQEISTQEVKEAFQNENLEVITDSNDLLNKLKTQNSSLNTILLMSSGNFDGLNLEEILDA